MGCFVAVLLLFAALLMELAAQSSKGIKKDMSQLPEELSPIRSAMFLYFLFSLLHVFFFCMLLVLSLVLKTFS